MKPTTQPYTFVSHEPAKALESFDQNRQQYRELLARYHSHLKTAVYSFAVAVPAVTTAVLGTYCVKVSPDNSFIGSVGVDLVTLAVLTALGLGGVTCGTTNLLQARDTEKKLLEQEQRMEANARKLDDLILRHESV